MFLFFATKNSLTNRHISPKNMKCLKRLTKITDSAILYPEFDCYTNGNIGSSNNPFTKEVTMGDC